MRNYSKTEYDAIGTPTVNTQTTYTGADLAAAKTGTGAERWRPVVVQALAMLGQPASLADGVIRRIAFESGGNPTAINKTDSNARAGHPSQGLMQTIPGTFDTYSGSLKARGINDPLANIYAGLNYAIHRYGSIAAIDPKVRPKGY
jgi:SLT domain-containing protein